VPRILLRRSTAANWTTTNPVLGDGEPAIEHDTGRMKIGDGVTTWLALAYTGGGGGPIASTDITDATTVGKAVLTAADAPTARSALGAASATSLATVATSGAYSDLTGKPTIPATAADVGAVPTTRTVAGHALSADVTITASDVGAATAAQGAKADTAVQPAGLTKAAVGLGSVDNTADATKAVLSASKLTTARTINGVSFDGTANITVALSALTGLLALAQQAAGTMLFQPFTAANAATQTRPTSRTDVAVTWVGDATTSSSTLPANALTGDPILTAA
jgi:hypothetical protein